MLENYIKPKRNGEGTTIESIGGNTSFSDHIDDVMMFIEKLYKALKVPRGRIDKESPFTPSGQEGDISREEIKFAKYVTRVRTRFADIIYQAFSRHLKLKGLWKQYNLEIDKFTIQFNEENEWRETKKIENWNKRLNLFRDMAEFSPGDENKVFSNEFLLKDILRMSDEDIEMNREQIKREEADEDGSDTPGSEGETEDCEETPEEPEPAEEESEIL